MKRIIATISALIVCAQMFGQVAVVAHRGFWNCEAGGFSQNSIAALKAAQDNGFWGSECDIHITADNGVIVNHDSTIKGLKIGTSTYAELSQHLLPNGEKRPTLDEYLTQTEKCRTTMLVIELKKQISEQRESDLIDATLAALKAHNLYDPQRVMFISFSEYCTRRITELCPGFQNQFLAEVHQVTQNPRKWAKAGATGIDYSIRLFKLKTSWIKKAHKKGMSVNIWTVNEADDIQWAIDHNVDAITTNFPLLTRELLKGNEKTIK